MNLGCLPSNGNLPRKERQVIKTFGNRLGVTPCSKYFVFIFMYWVRPGCGMGFCMWCVYIGIVASGVIQQSLWLSGVVLNQRQVFIVVSDWEPYLGSHILCVFGG